MYKAIKPGDTWSAGALTDWLNRKLEEGWELVTVDGDRGLYIFKVEASMGLEGDECCCGETDQSWRICPIHGEC